MTERNLVWSLATCMACTASEDAQSDGDDPTESEGSAESTGSGDVIDADAVLARALRFADELERVTAMSQPSQHGLADTVHVWVEPDAAASFRMLDPAADEGTDVAFPPGTLFVKEHLDADGVDVGLTIMFRGPEGYAPDSADWWWGRTNAAGVLQDEGQVGFCIGCHAGANAEAYVFGVASDNQTP